MPLHALAMPLLFLTVETCCPSLPQSGPWQKCMTVGSFEPPEMSMLDHFMIYVMFLFHSQDEKIL